MQRTRLQKHLQPAYLEFRQLSPTRISIARSLTLLQEPLKQSRLGRRIPPVAYTRPKIRGGVMVRARQFLVLTILLFSVFASGQSSEPTAQPTEGPAPHTVSGPAFDVRAAVE